MNQIQEAARRMALLSVYRGILERSVPEAFFRLLNAPQANQPEVSLTAWGNLIALLGQRNAGTNFVQALIEPVLYDENTLSVAATSGKEVSSLTEAAALCDLRILTELSTVTPQEMLAGSAFPQAVELDLPCWENGQVIAQLQQGPRACLMQLRASYTQNGCGRFARNRAFIWRNGMLSPVQHPDPTPLKDLKGYELQRGMALENVSLFVQGLPANNCLLYGDRGMGKSSTVRALLHEFPSLCLVEMSKAEIPHFPDLVEILAGLPMKFIVLINDLSFLRQDDTYTALKTVLEGGLAVRPENMLIYTASSRRHLLRETFSDREGDEIHRVNTIQESLSLADRFGPSVRFMLSDKAQYLDIVEKLAHQHDLSEYLPQLLTGAERFALECAGRSPRYAQQYVRLAESRIRQGKSIL